MGRDTELGSPQNYGRIELAYALMAKAAGIEMAPCRLLEENGRAHFMTRRFDRAGNQKLHLQSLCAMSHLDYRQQATHDYSQYFETIRQLELGDSALEQGFRRMAFNVFARNCDDHTKNLAFLLPEGGHWQLAPAYDVTLAYNPEGEWTHQHQMAVNGKFRDIGRDDLLAVADRWQIGGTTRALKDVGAAVAAWPEFANQAGLADESVRRIGALHRRV
jgi:serine/threonine-protein kinase HipA